MSHPMRPTRPAQSAPPVVEVSEVDFGTRPR